ncbi:MAG TPA: S41 family peptidase [Caulobacteraceae bacterium]|jgi:tricorn protease|nr:S41 family peptidase [Caulobacteraceae bacterium]
MKRSRLVVALLSAAAPLVLAAAAHAALPRFPQPMGDRIVFVADGNVWSVGKNGGEAVRLTSAQGQDMFPRASPDGRWIAYTEASRTGTDIWIIPAAGGPARRLTYHPASEAGTGGRHGPDNMVLTWTNDSRFIVFMTKRDQWNGQVWNLYKVSVDGGPATAMPIDSAVGLMSFAPDGHTIAYNRIFRNFRTWKRYNGGLAQQLFTYDFDSKALNQITTWSGTNTSPMWYGRKIYYLSDQDEHRRANIWCYDLDSKQTREVTHFTDYDIDFPALGSDAIAFQQGGKLWRIDLPNEELHEVQINVPDDNTRTRVRVDAVKDEVRDSDPAGQVDYALSPNGKRAMFTARGDLFSVPAEYGATRNLTQTESADEDHPAWSPDGRTVAYTTDVSGGQQIAVRPAEGGPETVLTSFAKGYFYGPVWSPDNRSVAFSDSDHKLWLLDTRGGAPKQVAQDPQNEIHDQSFSPDGRWLAFSQAAYARKRSLYLYEIATGKTTRLGKGDETDAGPVWSPDGKYLYFVSNRHENTVPVDQEFDFAVLKSGGVYAIPLAKETPSPLAPRSDEGDSGPAEGAEPTKASNPTGGKPPSRQHTGKEEPPPQATGLAAPIRIDLDGLMDRAVAMPIGPANIAALDARGQRIYYLTQPIGLVGGNLPGEDSELHFYDLKARKDSTIASDVDSYSLSLDGERIMVKQKDAYTVLDTKADAAKDKDTAKKLNLDHMRVEVDPPKEWAEMFNNAWRLERDLFFSSEMNEVNWQAVHDNYAKLLPELGSREDLNYLIGQMISELSNSHTYVGDGDDGDSQPKPSAALLGVDWTVDAATGRYRIAKIYPGDNTREGEGYRSPLGAPGLDVHEGDYVLAINGTELRTPDDPDKLLQLADAQTTVDLTIADSANGPRRHIVAKPIKNELSLREQAWITHNRDVVDKLSGGKIGYVYMSDMGQLGLQQFMRQFYSQLDRQALIMDDRWNGGGFIAPYALDRLRRELVALDVDRERAATTEPNDFVNGPKVALLNHWSSSDGDIFPYFFKHYHLGPLVGTRSWGGVRGIRGEWRLLDGGYITIPESALYAPDSQWAVENHGVDPDVEVEDTPAQLLSGHDAQLETAVDMLMKQIAGKPAGLPPPPPLNPPYQPSGMVPPQPQGK